MAWAQQNQRSWAFTLSNAGAFYFEDRCDLTQLNEINWNAVRSNQWGGIGVSPSIKEAKQAEFLMHESFPWELVERIGVVDSQRKVLADEAIDAADHKPVDVVLHGPRLLNSRMSISCSLWPY